jgi:hypothetical protein
MACRWAALADTVRGARATRPEVLAMLQPLGDLLPYAVTVALSPLPIIAALMLLLAPAGTRGGLGFLVGRMAALAALVLVLAILTARLAGPEASTGGRGGWLRIGLGCLVLVGAALIWQRRPRGAAAELPGWLRSVEAVTPAGALRLGALLTVANLKELALVLGAAVIVGGADLAAGGTFALALAFAAVASLGVAAPLAWSLAAGDAARARLGAARDWLVRNNALVIATVLVLVGAMLIGSGLEAI